MTAYLRRYLHYFLAMALSLSCFAADAAGFFLPRDPLHGLQPYPYAVSAVDRQCDQSESALLTLKSRPGCRLLENSGIVRIAAQDTTAGYRHLAGGILSCAAFYSLACLHYSPLFAIPPPLPA